MGPGTSADAMAAYRQVLVVDDHGIVRAGIVNLLQRLLPRAEVIEAGSRTQALERLRGAPDIGLVTLDLALPDGDRLSVLRDIRRDFSGVPVVVLSALEDATLAAQAMNLGAVGYIPKSTDPELIENALRVVLAGGSYVPRFLLAAQRARGPAPAETLTERQREVLSLLAQGLPNKEIARTLGLSETTVKTHLATIFRVLKARNRSQALLAARDHLLG